MKAKSAKSHAASLIGVEAKMVEVEAQLVSGLKRFALIGLPDGALRESKERIRCAVNSCGLPFPHDELVVSLGPAAVPKYGSGYDLAIALSIIGAQGLISDEQLSKKVFIGEVALNGEVKAVAGVIAAAAMVKDLDEWEIIYPAANYHQASIIRRARAIAVKNIQDALFYLRGEKSAEELNHEASDRSQSRVSSAKQKSFADVVGQYAAKRALEISAAGGHNLLMIGPPGVGKSMLAERLPCILPPLTDEEIIEILKIHSASKFVINADDFCYSQLLGIRPYRAPHHTTSYAGLIGGGSDAAPGEISLAHKGVLFLDELPEFKREVIESLRVPLETKEVHISRAKQRVKYPADFTLICAMNPCPCGKRGSPYQSCMCGHAAISRYVGRVSGPFVDRLDLKIWVPALNASELSRSAIDDTTETMKDTVRLARQIQIERFGGTVRTNSSLSGDEIKQNCKLSNSGIKLMDSAIRRFGLSARAYSRILRVARTIADIDQQTLLSDEHLAEAISYRGKDLNG